MRSHGANGSLSAVTSRAPHASVDASPSAPAIPTSVGSSSLPTISIAENRRAITLAADVSDVLLSMLMPASEVASAGITICERFCARPVNVDVTSTLLTFSQERTGSETPYTLARPVTPRGLNNMTIQAISQVVADVDAGRCDLDEAERRVREVIVRPRRIPWWAYPVSAGGVSAGVVPLFSTSLFSTLLTFIAGVITERVLIFLLRHRAPAFFAQAGAALVLTLLASGMTQVASTFNWPPVDARMVIVGGVVMLLVGLMFVGAFQDAIDEFYVTASARLLKVIMLTAGIVTGILAGVAVARWAGLAVDVTLDPLPMNTPVWLSTIGAALIAGMYCWYCQSTSTAIAFAAGVGAVIWWVFLLLWHSGVHMVAAVFLAAILAGLAGALINRRWGIPGSAITTAGIVTMVPGIMLFTGLLQLVNYPPGHPRFSEALSTLTVALGIGLGIAAGASLGLSIGRPLRRSLVLARNAASKRRRAGGRSGEQTRGASPARRP